MIKPKGCFMKKLVALALLFSVVALPVFAEDAAAPVCSEEKACQNGSCTCNPCECDPCECKDAVEEVACCGQENCPHGDNDDHKNNK
jgi:hypothetical protein